MCKIQDMKNFKKYFLFICILFLFPFILSGCTVSEEKVSEYERIVSDADLLTKGKNILGLLINSMMLLKSY